MSQEEKSLDSFTHSVMLDCDAKFTTIINEKEKTVEFIYVDNIHIRQYCSVYNFNDIIFCNVLPQFLRYIFEELLTNKSYKISEVSDAFVNIIFHYKVMKKDSPINIRLNVKDFTGTSEGSLSEVEYLKAQVSQMRTEMNIMKNVLARNVNKVRITLSTVTNQNFACRDNLDNKFVLRVPADFIYRVNMHVLTVFAKIVEVRVKKISHLMKIDVELELYSKECYYFLSHQAKTEFETKSFENMNEKLTETSKPIFFGSGNIKDPFGTNLNVNGTEIVGIYLMLHDRRKRDANARSINLSIHRDDSCEYGNVKLCIDGCKYFPADHFPLNNFEEYNGSLYAITINKKEIEDIKDVVYQRKLINDCAIIEKLLEP